MSHAVEIALLLVKLLLLNKATNKHKTMASLFAQLLRVQFIKCVLL